MKQGAVLIAGGRIIDPSQGLDIIGDLLLMDGEVARVDAAGSVSAPERCAVISAGGMVVCPGFVDLHCHLRQPGQEEKETVATGTRAAARGGFTTVCCMPNTRPPIESPDIVTYVLDKARTEGVVRVLPVACITRGQQGRELVNMKELAGSGAVAFSEDGWSVADPELMRRALEWSRHLDLPVMDHCEDARMTGGGAMNEGSLSVGLGLKGMPSSAEDAITGRDIELAELIGARLHISHVSTAASLDLVRRARERGVRVTAEVTPHHLALSQESVPDCGTSAKVNPPLRTSRDNEMLLDGLRKGVIDAVATDHAPHALHDKQCGFEAAAFGISGLETALGVLLGFVHEGRLDLVTLVSRLTAGPAMVLTGGGPVGGAAVSSVLSGGVPHGLGTLRVGAPGDVTIFDQALEWVVNPDSFVSKGKNNPWAGRRLKGKVMATLFDGEIVYMDEDIAVEVKGLP